MAETFYLRGRAANGPTVYYPHAYKSVDDPLAIQGIGQKGLDKMRKYLSVGKAPPTKAASTKPATPPKPPPT